MSKDVPSGYTINWQGMQNVASQSFRCGHCGNKIASNLGWYATSSYTNKPAAYVVVCHLCQRPTFIDADGRQFPGEAFGDKVESLPSGVKELYDEARGSTGANAFTTTVLCCRKILMHVAVQKGAQPGEKFVKYVEFLADKNFIPPDARPWVDHIRTRSNEANHEILIMTRADAEELLAFTEMLLKVVFEFPAVIKKKLEGSVNGK
jgi:hypothetical protein